MLPPIDESFQVAPQATPETTSRPAWLEERKSLLSEIDRLKSVTFEAAQLLIASSIDMQRMVNMTDNHDDDALRDPLTGLYNKATIQELIYSLTEMGEESHFGVIVGDLFGFKHINDKLGHSTGDTVLRLVGDRLHNSLRSGTELDETDPKGLGDDYIAHAFLKSPSLEDHAASREGGDEFTILSFLTPHEDTDFSPEERLTAIQQRVEQSVLDMVSDLQASEDPEQRTLGEFLHKIHFHMDMGCQVWKPGMSRDDLVDRADQQMFATKREAQKDLIRALPPEKKAALTPEALSALRDLGGRIDLELIAEELGHALPEA